MKLTMLGIGGIGLGLFLSQSAGAQPIQDNELQNEINAGDSSSFNLGKLLFMDDHLAKEDVKKLNRT